jgi:exosortase
MSQAESTRDQAPETNAWNAQRRLVVGGVALIALAIAIYASILYHMVLFWHSSDDYSHGFLIVPLALFFAYERKYDLAAARIEGSWWGVVPLTLASLALAIGRLGVELMAMRTSFVLTLIGIVLLVFGRRIFRILLFPLLFLFLMVPLPQSLLNVVAFPLQLMAARMAEDALHFLAIPALVEGNIIHLANAELFVAEACSGLRSVMALLTLGVVMAKFFQRGAGARLLLVASTIPIAILVNAIRVTLTGILTHHYGQEAAHGTIHDFQGLITFGVAFLILMLEARTIDWVRSLRQPLRAGGGDA